jgi:hypothetical protein
VHVCIFEYQANAMLQLKPHVRSNGSSNYLILNNDMYYMQLPNIFWGTRPHIFYELSLSVQLTRM